MHVTSVDALPVTGTLVSSGARIAYGVAGAADAPLVLLVHGSRAHRQWWARVVPLLSDRVRVGWLDLSGHGDSAHRDAYDVDLWAREVLDVVELLSTDAPTVIAGHSMGGRISIAAVEKAPKGLVDALVLLEARLWQRDESDRPQLRPRDAPTLFEDREAALAKFRLSPAQHFDDEPLRRLLASAALRPVDGGWTWKYDHRGIPPLTGDDILDRLVRVDVPVTAAWGSDSAIIGPDYRRLLEDNVTASLDVGVVEGAGHHVPADSPAETAAIILHALSTVIGESSYIS